MFISHYKGREKAKQRKAKGFVLSEGKVISGAAGRKTLFRGKVEFDTCWQNTNGIYANDVFSLHVEDLLVKLLKNNAA